MHHINSIFVTVFLDQEVEVVRDLAADHVVDLEVDHHVRVWARVVVNREAEVNLNRQEEVEASLLVAAEVHPEDEMIANLHDKAEVKVDPEIKGMYYCVCLSVVDNLLLITGLFFCIYSVSPAKDRSRSRSRSRSPMDEDDRD